MNLLIIDLDGTITKSDNLVGFSLFMLFEKKQIRFFLSIPLLFLLRLKLIDNLKFKIWYAYLILKNMDVNSLSKYAADYVISDRFKNDINTVVLEFILKQTNAENVILSANFDFIAETVAKHLKIKECESIRLEQINGRYTGFIKSAIPYGMGKVEVFQQNINNEKFDRTIGIGDSQSDLFLLKYLDEGYLVTNNLKNGSTVLIKVLKLTHNCKT